MFASYFAPGRAIISVDSAAFASAGIDSPPLHALQMASTVETASLPIHRPACSRVVVTTQVTTGWMRIYAKTRDTHLGGCHYRSRRLQGRHYLRWSSCCGRSLRMRLATITSAALPMEPIRLHQARLGSPLALQTEDNYYQWSSQSRRHFATSQPTFVVSGTISGGSGGMKCL